MEFFIIKCMNKECHNYNMELNEGTEICSLCNTPVTQVEIKANRPLAKKALMLGIIGFIVTMGGGMFLGGIILNNFIIMLVLEIGGVLATIAGIVLGVRSKSTSAIVIQSLCALVSIGQMLLWYFLWELM